MGAIEEARAKSKEDRKAFLRRIEENRRGFKVISDQMEEEVFPCLVNATPVDYNKWITGYIKRGGKPSHAYDYPAGNHLMIATYDIQLMPLYGSSSLNIIVPEGITIKTPEGLGHSNLYFMAGFHCRGGFVPVFSDTRELTD